MPQAVTAAYRGDPAVIHVASVLDPGTVHRILRLVGGFSDAMFVEDRR
jgi:hypothetical protein